MPQRPPRPCATPGCPRLLRPGEHCPDHAHSPHAIAAERARPSSAARGYNWTWRKVSKAHLAAHPLCVHCERGGRVTAATQVDHIIPHRGDDRLRLDPSNLQSLCASCHSAKTAREDGGFGHQPLRQD